MSILAYNPVTGVFTWRDNRAHRKAKAGDVAGGLNDKGYLIIRHNDKSYKAHRLAYLYVYGYMPEIIDHKNRIKNDNKILNLREVASSQNSCNRNLSSANTSGVTGVSWNPQKGGRWVSRISVNGKRKHLGYYLEFDEAVKVRLDAELALWF